MWGTAVAAKLARSPNPSKNPIAVAGVTLGQVCAARLVALDVSCHVCPRRGRYRLTRLIDRQGAGKSLIELKDLLSADCPQHAHESFFRSCGVYFAGWCQPVKPRTISKRIPPLEPLIAGVPNLRARIFDQE